MRKVTVWGHWFYFVSAIVMLVVVALYDWLAILLMIAQPKIMFSLILLLLVGIAMTSFIIVWACNFFMQFTVISEDCIKTRAVWRTIRALKWEQVKEVRYERLNISSRGGFTSGWFVFDDGVERNQPNGLVRKNTHIVMRATKRTRKIIDMFWRGPIVERNMESE